MLAKVSIKKATNLSIRADLLAEAKSLNIDLSQAFEIHLAELVKLKRQEQWLKETREAIAAYNQRVEEQGVFSDDWRMF